jgi:hypothetical protein
VGEIAQAIVWVAAFAFLAAVLLIPAWLRHRSRMATLRLISEAASRGQPLDPTIIEHLATAARSNLSRWFTYFCLFCGPGPLMLGIVVGVAAGFFADPLGLDASLRTSLLIPALYAGGAGLGFTLLGVLCVRLFLRKPEM